MRKPLVAGNWKMNGSLAQARELSAAVKAGLSGNTNVDVVLCPTSIYLQEVAKQISGSGIALGAQNVSDKASGAFTGEVSSSMLKDIGCRYVLVGHSERRSIYGETDADVASKAIAASVAGLIPVVCVGELLKDRESGDTEVVVARQLDALLESNDGLVALQHSVIAYEPVWAIGTGMTATPEQAQSVHEFIRKRISNKDVALGEKMRILYGGSVNAGNSAELFAKPDIDGGLIGGASLSAENFLAICNSAVAG